MSITQAQNTSPFTDDLVRVDDLEDHTKGGMYVRVTKVTERNKRIITLSSAAARAFRVPAGTRLRTFIGMSRNVIGFAPGSGSYRLGKHSRSGVRQIFCHELLERVHMTELTRYPCIVRPDGTLVISTKPGASLVGGSQ